MNREEEEKRALRIITTAIEVVTRGGEYTADFDSAKQMNSIFDCSEWKPKC